MKKFFLSVPVIFTLILTLFAPLSVSAAEISVPTDYFNYPFYDRISESPFSSSFPYFSVSDYQSKGYSSDNYICIQFYSQHESMDNIFYSYTVYFWFNGSSSEISVDSDSGIYHIFSSSNTFSDFITSYCNDISSDPVSSYPNMNFSHSNENSGVTDIIFNSNTSEFYYKIGGSWGKIYGIINDVDSNIFNYNPGLNLEVKFNPNLSGNLDRIIDQNGVKAESDYFSMEVINHSSKNAQFLFAIVPEGVNFELSKGDLSGSGINAQSSGAIFYFLSKEWVYSPTIGGTILANRKTESFYNQSTPWHFIQAGSSYQRSFSWSQINISKDVIYDAVVLAISTPHDNASKVFTYSSNEHYLDISDFQEVYRSSFSVDNPVPYNSSNSEFGNEPNSGFSGLVKANENANAYVDKETGEVVVEDVSSKEKLDARAEWEPGLIQNDISGFDLSSVKSILGESKAVFNFFGEALGFMPSWFWSLLILGISSIVVIGIIKALK